MYIIQCLAPLSPPNLWGGGWVGGSGGGSGIGRLVVNTRHRNVYIHVMCMHCLYICLIFNIPVKNI